MEEALKNLLRRIEATNNQVTAKQRDVITVGSFQAMIDPGTDMTWLNYAVPTASLGTSAAVAQSLLELRHVFEERDRILRFEFTESLWSALPAALEEAGLQLEARHPMMLCTPADLQPYQSPAVQVQLLTPDAHPDILAACVSIPKQSFSVNNAAEAPTAQEITELKEQIYKGIMQGALAYLNGIPAGVGFAMPMLGISELVGVATLPAQRRRGVAATLCTALVNDHFKGGGELVWLSAGDAIAQATYERIGFCLVDARLNYIDTRESQKNDSTNSEFLAHNS
ncbi:MAG: GNAT family N-acetyltransferase [Microcoleus sp. SIO2G3]|nr:GNAT family N-acetyltransferase [Microcoleus sp. SIO2G3]